MPFLAVQASYLEMGTNCILLLCVHVFVYLGSVTHVYREHSGPVVARVLDQKQRD